MRGCPDPLAVGGKIRALRRQLHLTQADVARRVGISSSYLNLIEHNRRKISASLLIKLAEILRLICGVFRRMTTGRSSTSCSRSSATRCSTASTFINEDVRELVTVYPALSHSIVRLYGNFRTARQSTQALAESLTEDARQEGAQLARSPNEEVSDLVQRHMNYFPELEAGAETLGKDAKLDSESLFAGLVQYLKREADIEVRVEQNGAMQSAVRRYDPERRLLTLSEVLRRGSRNFQLAYQVGLHTQSAAINRIVDDPPLTSEESRASCRIALANDFAAAVLMPYDVFLAAAQKERYDIELLGHRFRASFEQTCHRLTTLRKPNADGIPFHMLRVDVAGNMSKRFSASGLKVPRFFGACPRWNVFAAFLTPGVIHTQVSQMPDGQTFFGVARTVRKDGGGFADRARSTPSLSAAMSRRRTRWGTRTVWT